MDFKSKDFINTMLGESFLEDLVKFEIIKPQTDTAVDHEELATALQIVPRTVMAWLINNLSNMEERSNRTLELPFPKAKGAKLYLKKIVNDAYSGEIIQDGKVVNKFFYRTIPGIGLIILTTFEMYELEKLDQSPAITTAPAVDINKQVQAAIEERLNFKRVIEQVVDHKLAQKDAIEALILAKLSSPLSPLVTPPVEKLVATPSPILNSKKPLKLKEFLENKKTKPYSIDMKKSEKICCGDCGQVVFAKNDFTGCICLGEDRDKKISMKKSENGVEIKFGKTWEIENIHMVLETLRNKRTGK